MPSSIEQLSSHPEFEEAVIGWLHDEWGAAPADSRAFLPPGADRPGAILACVAGTPIGVLAYKRHQSRLQSKPELWINSVYVVPEFRSRGIARELIQAGLRLPAQFRNDPLYVYTHLPELYQPCGWELIHSDEQSGMHTLCFSDWDLIGEL